MSERQTWAEGDPLIDVRIGEPDVMAVQVVGLPYRTPPEWGQLRRGDFNRVMDHIYGRWPMPMTCRITEVDGTVHEGVIDLNPARHPGGPDATDGTPPPPPLVPSGRAPLPPPVPRPPDGDTAVRRRGRHVRPRRALIEPGDHLIDTEAESTAADLVVDRFAPGEPVVIALTVVRVTADDQGRVEVARPVWLDDSQVVVAGVVSGRAEIVGGQ